MLERRRRELMRQVRGKIRDVRANGDANRDVPDHEESTEVDVREDIDFALIQMQSEALHNVDAALRRLEEGAYGNCSECGDQISEARLGALPFAVRCRDCEGAREEAARRMALPRRDKWGSFFGVSG